MRSKTRSTSSTTSPACRSPRPPLDHGPFLRWQHEKIRLNEMSRQSLDAWTAARARADARQYAPTVRRDVEHPAVDERYRVAAESLWRATDTTLSEPPCRLTRHPRPARRLRKLIRPLLPSAGACSAAFSAHHGLASHRTVGVAGQLAE